VQFRLTASYRDFGGLLNNVYLNRHPDFSRELSLRGAFHFDLAPGLTADLRGSYALTSGGALNWVYQPAKFAANSCYLDTSNPFGGPAGDANRVTRDLCANNLGHDRREVYETSLKVAYQMPFATISNVLAYIDLAEDSRADQFPYSASRNVYGTDGTQTQFERVKAWSDEFRITSPNAQSLRWMVGSYFLDTRRFISSSTGVDEGNGILQVTYQPHFNDPLNPTNSFLADHNHNQAYAFFGNLAYDLTSKLEASFGFRYDHDNHRQTIRADSTAGFRAAAPSAIPMPVCGKPVSTAASPRSRSITGRRPTSPSLPITASGSVRGSTTRPGRPRPRTFRASMIWPSPKAPIRPKAGSRRVFSTASCA
jgi:iron complex outermembrane receptor protein